MRLVKLFIQTLLYIAIYPVIYCFAEYLFSINPEIPFIYWFIISVIYIEIMYAIRQVLRGDW